MTGRPTIIGLAKLAVDAQDVRSSIDPMRSKACQQGSLTVVAMALASCTGTIGDSASGGTSSDSSSSTSSSGGTSSGGGPTGTSIGGNGGGGRTVPSSSQSPFAQSERLRSWPIPSWAIQNKMSSALMWSQESLGPVRSPWSLLSTNAESTSRASLWRRERRMTTLLPSTALLRYRVTHRRYPRRGLDRRRRQLGHDRPRRTLFDSREPRLRCPAAKQ
jgi:hypothetical protein